MILMSNTEITETLESISDTISSLIARRCNVADLLNAMEDLLEEHTTVADHAAWLDILSTHCHQAAQYHGGVTDPRDEA